MASEILAGSTTDTWTFGVVLANILIVGLNGLLLAGRCAEIPSGSHLTEMLALICSASLR